MKFRKHFIVGEKFLFSISVFYIAFDEHGITFLNHGYFIYLGEINKPTLARITLHHKYSLCEKILIVEMSENVR